MSGLSAEKGLRHPFVLILDDEPVEGHLFGTLKRQVGNDWVALERRCRLCNRLPIELLTTDFGTVPCAGLTSVFPSGVFPIAVNPGASTTTSVTPSAVTCGHMDPDGCGCDR